MLPSNVFFKFVFTLKQSVKHGLGGGGGDCTHLKCTFRRVVALHPSAPHLWWDYPSSEYPRSRSMESQRSHIPKKTSTHTGTRTFVCYLIVVCTEVKKIFPSETRFIVSLRLMNHTFLSVALNENNVKGNKSNKLMNKINFKFTHKI